MTQCKSLPTVDDCAGCGVCCLHMGYPVYIRADDGLADGAQRPEGQRTEEHWTKMPADLKRELLAYMEQYQEPSGALDGPCLWFDQQTRRCKHHEFRPQVCRDFQVGSKGCQQWRDVYQDQI